MSRHRLSVLDRLRGWHWQGDRRIRNWCGCEIERADLQASGAASGRVPVGT